MEEWRIGSARAVRPHHSTASSAGFTLIELLAVMAIGAILISLGIAGYSEMRKTTGVGTGARYVFDKLSLARQLAVTSGRRTRFLIDIATQQITIIREIPGIRIGGGGYWVGVAEWEALPVNVFILTNTVKNLSGTGGFSQMSERVYTNGTPAMWYTNYYYVAAQYSWPGIEFSGEGRPSQTWTVTVARGYTSGTSFITNTADYALVIVDGQTGKARLVRR